MCWSHTVTALDRACADPANQLRVLLFKQRRSPLVRLAGCGSRVMNMAKGPRGVGGFSDP